MTQDVQVDRCCPAHELPTSDRVADRDHRAEVCPEPDRERRAPTGLNQRQDQARGRQAR
jgi:hypothetical protein